MLMQIQKAKIHFNSFRVGLAKNWYGQLGHLILKLALSEECKI